MGRASGWWTRGAKRSRGAKCITLKHGVCSRHHEASAGHVGPAALDAAVVEAQRWLAGALSTTSAHAGCYCVPSRCLYNNHQRELPQQTRCHHRGGPRRTRCYSPQPAAEVRPRGGFVRTGGSKCGSKECVQKNMNSRNKIAQYSFSQVNAI